MRPISQFLLGKFPILLHSALKAKKICNYLNSEALNLKLFEINREKNLKIRFKKNKQKKYVFHPNRFFHDLEAKCEKKLILELSASHITIIGTILL